MPSTTKQDSLDTAATDGRFPDEEQVLAELEAEESSVDAGPSEEEPAMSPQEAQSALDAMLSSEPPSTPVEPYTVTRLGMTLKLRGVSEQEIDVVGRRSERQPTKSERARGIFAPQRDSARFNLLLTATGMVDPDLTDSMLQGKFGPRPEDIVRKWFLPGEIIQMADQIMDLSGYGDEAVVRAGKS
jgi:hypothetical protein